MKTVNIHEAKTHLSRLVEEALAGETVVIGKAGKPLVVLTPYAPPARNRIGGQLRGQIVEAADCWSANELADAVDSPLYPMPERIPAKVAEGKGP